MTPADLRTVQGSWAELRRRRSALLDALTCCYDGDGPALIAADLRAGWLYAAIEELVALLPAPSRLAERACDLGKTWPDPLTAPCFAVEGRAWMAAARACLPTWSDETELAWRQAWLLLSDVLAAETLSPFADGWDRASTPPVEGGGLP